MIDWFTVVAQIVNFLILVALLKYFLYGRILAAMETREHEIAQRWDEAKSRRDEAAQELANAHDKNRQIDNERERMLARVRDEVEANRRQLTAEARDEVARLQSRWLESIQEETESFFRDLRRRISEEVCEVARRALVDLADADLEGQVVARFLYQFDALDGNARESLVASLDGNGRVAVIQTGNELSKELRTSVTKTMRQRLGDDLEVRFEVSPELLCGIALQTDSHKLAWDLRDYLASLEQRMHVALEVATPALRSQPTESARLEE